MPSIISTVANGYIIKQLTDNTVDDEHPQISDSNIVWDTPEVYLSKNGSQTILLDDDVFLSALPQVSGNNVAWMKTGFGFNASLDFEIYFYDGNTSIFLRDSSQGVNPQISGNNVVWEDNSNGDWEIYFYNGSSTLRLTDNSFDDENPEISGNNIVWQGNDEIYLYDGSKTIQLTDNTFDDEKPQISDNNVVWQGNDEIYLYDGSKTIQLTDNTFNDEKTQISGNNVVWQGNGEIYFYNGSSTIQLTNNSFNDENPQISGNNVVWQGNGEIYLYNGSSTIQLTNNTFDDEDPQISGNNVVWQGKEGTDYEIYLATPDTSVSLLPSLSINNLTVVEGRNSQAILTVNLSSASSIEVTVNYATNSGTATADSDYTSQNGTLTFAANTTTATISIPIINNNAGESDETFSITLSNPTNATIQQDTGSINITNTLPIANDTILDIDGSGGQPTFSRDGLLISAFLFFYQPDRTNYSVLDKFILDDNATLKTGNDITNTLKDKLSVFDADGSGQTTFSRDGLLISAFLFFYQADRTDYSVLDKFILDSNASRTTGNDVANYLKDLMGINAAAIYSDSTDKVNIQEIFGTAGNDFLTGNSNNVRIFGDAGDDLLMGGSGKDTFVFGINSDRDLITDFNVTEDLIQIDSSLGFSNSEAVFSASTSLGMVDDRFVTELVFDANNKITVFSNSILTADNFFVNNI